MKIFIDSRESGAVFSAFRRAAADPALRKTLKEKDIEVSEQKDMPYGSFISGDCAVGHMSAEKEDEEPIEIIQQNNMESGDFVCGDCAIEHKTPADYRTSVMTRHLNDQTLTMKRNFRECAIVYSGHDYELFRDMLGGVDKFGTGTVASFMAQGIPVIPCGDLDVMAVLVIKLLHKWTDKKIRDHNPNINQRVSDDVRLNMLTAIPDIGVETGRAILEKFVTIEDIFNASVKELMTVPGVGQKTAIAIYSAFHSPDW